MLRDVFKPAAILLAVCAVITAGLAFTYSATRDTIAERIRLEAEEARREVHGAADSFKPYVGLDKLKKDKPELEPVTEVFIGYRGDKETGHVFSIIVKGYGGDLQMTVGIDGQGTITGVRIGENSETPGLGSKATDQPFLSQFEGLLPQKTLEVTKTEGGKPEEISAISGATITSRAVTSGVQAAVEAARVIRQEGGGKQ